MESLYLYIEHVNKCIKETEELLKKYPNSNGLKISLESMKMFREEAIKEIDRRGDYTGQYKVIKSVCLDLGVLNEKQVKEMETHMEEKYK